jgi:hypothetical protein
MEFLNCSNKRPGRFQRGDNHKNAKMWWSQLKNFLSRIIEPEELKYTRKLSDIM